MVYCNGFVQFAQFSVALTGNPVRHEERLHFADIFQVQPAVPLRRYQDCGSDYFDRTKRNQFHTLR